MFSINGEQWRLLFVPSNHVALLKPNGKFAIGACDDYTKTIYLDKNLTGDYLKKVMCHEITHAAMFSYNVVLSYAQEELLADLLATYGAEIIETANLIFHRIIENREFI
jgi:hypothetical protein